jgi:DNA (cytosine-5)-methyltransferase 1
MARVRSRDTGPELAFRRAIWRRGFRFRICDARFPGKPDLVFPRHRLAVFIDGDFWHGAQWRRRKLAALDEQFVGAENASYWKSKIRRNIERDFRHTAAMLDAGWRVLRFWESDLAKSMERCVDSTAAALADAPTPRSAASTRRRDPAPQNLLGEGPVAAIDRSLLARRTVAEFFAGIGLVRLAMEQHGWSVVWANDFDPQKAVMYRERFGAEHLSTADIHEVDAASVPRATLFTASFPCTDLSVAGGRRGLDGKGSGAFWGFVRVLREMGAERPPLVLLENVVGFLNSHGGRDFETALLALNALGYRCDALVLNASSFTPQSRARLFVIGCQERLSEPFGIVPPSAARPAALADFINSHPHIDWDIRRLPAPPRPTHALEEILEDLDDADPAWWSGERAVYFWNQLSERHRALAEQMVAGAEVTYATAFRRVRKGRSMAELRTDGLAGCLRTPRGGSGRQILFKAGRGRYQVRLLTPRECARLQGAADDYPIGVASNQALFGFGDAVCVPAVGWIVEHCLTPAAVEMLRGGVVESGVGSVL